ncbi:uncharacterized protein LOC143560752 [Bidens hawaiensis]|uniref:uncharacterized protein LOC143560752 n=1 Tax=Bidens hawaiensis TaxID=980011 RepID=UPI004049643D
MVKKFMSTKPKSRDLAGVIADDIRKKAAVGNGSGSGSSSAFVGLHKKLFGSNGKSDGESKKALLTDVKANANARTLAMVLRSERELLSLSKEHESEIAGLKLMLEDKNKEVDKLKDLCLKQREEIKALKDAVLFPDVMLPKKQEDVVGKQVIPNLQRQVTSLTGQLQCLAQELVEVKADKYSVMGCYESPPRTPTHEQEDAANSLELTSTTPGSPDDMFLNDLNPCLTPYANFKSKSKEFENQRCHETGFGRKLSKSSNGEHSAKSFSRRSDEYIYRGW